MMRLQTFISRAGISSRRSAVDIIRCGGVRVNGKRIFEPSFKVNPQRDKVFYNGSLIAQREKIYIMFHKPRGVVTTKKDRFAEKTVMDYLPRRYKHVNPVGRLDKDTTGLLLLTNDGELINLMTHPRFNIDKMYKVRLDRPLLITDKVRIERGIELDGRRTAPCRITLKNRNIIEVILHEGRKRQIRRMFKLLGYEVLGLERTMEGPLSLEGLRPGAWRFLTREEKSGLIKIK